MMLALLREPRSPENIRSRAESEYKAAFHALWHAAQVAQVPAVMDALKHYQRAAVTLSLTPRAASNSWGTNDVVKGWPMRGALAAADKLPPCPVCGGEVPRKSPSTTGPQQTYCSSKCRASAIARRWRDKKRGHEVQPVHVDPVPALKVAPLDKACEHEFVVMLGRELARKRKAAGWSPHFSQFLNTTNPHLVCTLCLRTYQRLRWHDPHVVHQPGPLAPSNGKTANVVRVLRATAATA